MTIWALLRRLTITVIGSLALLVGAILLIAPGPGFLVLALGLFILSLEYEWARRRLAAVAARARTLSDRSTASRSSMALTVIFALGTVGLGGVMAFAEFLPGSGPVTGACLIFGGLVILATLGYALIQKRRLDERPDSRLNSPP